MKNLIIIAALIIFGSTAFAQVTNRKTRNTGTEKPVPQKQVLPKTRTIQPVKTVTNSGNESPAPTAEEIARIKAYNWIAPFKNYGNFYTPETIGNLSTLDLSTGGPLVKGIPMSVYMSDDSLVHLLQFTGLKTLTATIGMTNKGLDYIGTLQNLTGLYLGRTRVNDSGLSKIAGLYMLETLVLYETPITNAGLEQIAATLGGLKILNISQTAINDAGLVHLSKLGYLEKLILSRGNFTDAAIPHILPLSNLTLISIEFTQISQAGKNQLRAAFPNATIIGL